MLSTRSLVYSTSVLSLVLSFLGRCDSRPAPPVLRSSDNIQTSPSRESDDSGWDSDSDSQSTIIAEGAEGLCLPGDWEAYKQKGERLYFESQRDNGLSQMLAKYRPREGKLTREQSSSFGDGRLLLQDFWLDYDFRDSKVDQTNMFEVGHRALGSVRFRCQVSVDHTAILVSEWSRGTGQASKDPSYAEVLWALWKDAVRRSRVDNLTQEAKLRRLRLIMFDPVPDPTTLELLEYALKGEVNHQWKNPLFEWEPVQQDSLSDFWALLGSPAGAAVQSLLNEHESFNKLHVTTIHADSNLGDDDDPEEMQGVEEFQRAFMFSLGMKKDLPRYKNGQIFEE